MHITSRVSRNNRIALIVVLALLFLFTTSCNSSMFQKQNKPQPVFDTKDLAVGNEGLTIAFQPEMPPAKVYKGETFNLGILAQNKGISDIVNGQILVSGYDTTYYTLSLRDLSTGTGNIIKEQGEGLISYNLGGKSLSDIQGYKELIIFSAEHTGKQIPGKNYPANFVVTACYTYKTSFTSTVCVNPSARDPTKVSASVCTIADQSFSGGQGAPVAITKVEQTVIYRNQNTFARYKVYVSNVGGGTIYKTDSFKKECSLASDTQNVGNEFNALIGAVTLTGAKLGNDPVHCSSVSGSQVLQLGKYDEGDYFVCEKDITNIKGNYVTPLVIQLSYGYVTKVRADVTIIQPETAPASS